MTDRLDRVDVFRIVRETIKQKYGNQRIFCESHGLNQQSLSDALNGRCDLSQRVLLACGLRRVSIYERVEHAE